MPQTKSMTAQLGATIIQNNPPVTLGSTVVTLGSTTAYLLDEYGGIIPSGINIS